MVDVSDGGWVDGQDAVRHRWAYAEALVLLERTVGLRERIQEQMVEGVTAVGDCA